jgi:hypothetical protein
MLQESNLSVIEQQMPPGASEVRNFRRCGPQKLHPSKISLS